MACGRRHAVLTATSLGAMGDVNSMLIAGRFKAFLSKALPHIRVELSHSFVKQTLADALSLEPATAALLLEGDDGVMPLGTDADRALPAIADFLKLAGDGLTATSFANETWAEPGQPPRVDSGIDTRWDAQAWVQCSVGGDAAGGQDAALPVSLASRR